MSWKEITETVVYSFAIFQHALKYLIRSWWEGKMYTCTVLFPFLLALTFLVWKPAATAWHYYLGGRQTEMSCSPFCLPFHTCIHAVLFCLFMLQNCWNVMSVDFCCSKQTENGNCRLEREQEVWWSLPWFPLDLLKLGILWCQHLLLFFFKVLWVSDSPSWRKTLIILVGLEKKPSHLFIDLQQRHWKTLCKAM